MDTEIKDLVGGWVGEEYSHSISMGLAPLSRLSASKELSLKERNVCTCM